MTNIEQKALELVRDIADGYEDVSIHHVHNAKALRSALCRAIEQHEAFRQEVSDAVSEIAKAWGTADPAWGYLRQFFIAKPDPLVEIMNEMGFGFSKTASEEFRAALAKRGGKIVFDEM